MVTLIDLKNIEQNTNYKLKVFKSVVNISPFVPSIGGTWFVKGMPYRADNGTVAFNNNCTEIVFKPECPSRYFLVGNDIIIALHRNGVRTTFFKSENPSPALELTAFIREDIERDLLEQIKNSLIDLKMPEKTKQKVNSLIPEDLKKASATKIHAIILAVYAVVDGKIAKWIERSKLRITEQLPQKITGLIEHNNYKLATPNSITGQRFFDKYNAKPNIKKATHTKDSLFKKNGVFKKSEESNGVTSSSASNKTAPAA